MVSAPASALASEMAARSEQAPVESAQAPSPGLRPAYLRCVHHEGGAHDIRLSRIFRTGDESGIISTSSSTKAAVVTVKAFASEHVAFCCTAAGAAA